MKKLFCLTVLLFCSLLCASTVSAQCQGNAYIYSLTSQTANSVHGYATTYLDYCAGLYYDPEVLGTFTETLPTSPALIGEGFSQGYMDQRPAEVQFDYRTPLNSAPYTVRGDHFLIAYYQVWVEIWVPGYYWYDPFQFGFGGMSEGYEIYYVPDFFGYYSYVSYWVSMREYIGTSSDTQIYQGQTQCLPGQQFTQTGQPCSSLPECQSGEQFTSAGDLCPNYVPPPEPPVQPVVSVHLFNNPLRPQGIDGWTNSEVATCITGVSNPAGQQVNLQLVNDNTNLQFDGGHKEEFHSAGRPLGKLGKSAGSTRVDGCFWTTYSPPHISGKFKLKSTISGITNDTDVKVFVPDLVQLKPGENYRLNGGIVDCNVPDDSCSLTIGRQAHPSNHWGVREVVENLPRIADAYKVQFYGNGYIPPSEMVHFNDMSLEWGGKFDLDRNWLEKGHHGEHRDGKKGIDVRSKNILPESSHDTLMQIFNNFGFAWNDERGNPKGPHWHLRWQYRRSNGTLNNTRKGVSISELQNGIDPNGEENTGVNKTPSTLVNNIGEAVFERQITQEEFEVWYAQMTNAKAQGLNTFLQEVKTFEKQLFASQEYLARQRTDDQFVRDVFASHLFREPTEPELSYWLDYLSDIGGTQEIVTDPTEPTLERTRTTISLNQQQRRRLFLDNFQTLPDFVNLVGSVVDDAYQEPLN